MRLIDADKLMADIDRQPLGGWQKQTVRCVLNDQPTAYNVDKVVKELKESLYDDNTYGCCDDLETIVKRGGLNG